MQRLQVKESDDDGVVATVIEGESVPKLSKAKKETKITVLIQRICLIQQMVSVRKRMKVKLQVVRRRRGKLSRRQAILLVTLVAKRKATHPWKGL